MFNLEPEKEYIIHLQLYNVKGPVETRCKGERVEEQIEDMKTRFPLFKRITVFDPVTGDAAGMIRG